MTRPALSDLPDWPGVMRAPEAAAYLQISEEAFRLHVAPKLRKVRLTPGSVGWARVELDRFILGEMECGASQPAPDPVAAAQGEWEAAFGPR